MTPREGLRGGGLVDSTGGAGEDSSGSEADEWSCGIVRWSAVGGFLFLEVRYAGVDEVAAKDRGTSAA